MMLREGRSITLDQMQSDVVDIDNNMATSGNIVIKTKNNDKNKQMKNPQLKIHILIPRMQRWRKR